MDINQHKEIILRWIRSCRTSEQLGLLTEVIQAFVVDRFSGQVQPHEMDMVRTELNAAIDTRKLIVARKRLKKKDILANLEDQRIDENLNEIID